MNRIVTEIVSCENQIHQFFLNQKIGSLLKRSNINKEKGIAPVAVFRMLFTLVFTGKNLFRTLESPDGSCCMAKDTVYRFLNSVHANWRRFLLLLSSRMIGRQIEPLTSAANMKVLVAHATIVCCRYMMLALVRRMNNDPRTLGSLFHASCDELKQVGFAEALALLLTLLEQALSIPSSGFPKS